MTDFSAWQFLPGAKKLCAAVSAELPQKDDFCGPIWALAAARVFADDVVADQEDAAVLANTTLWHGQESSLPARQPTRRDYARLLPATSDPERAGTDADGVVQAIESLSAGRASVTPYQPEGNDWTPETLASFFDSLAAEASPVVVLANLGTEYYLFPAHAQAPTDFLRTGSLTGYRPSPWQVGHFTAVLGWQEGPGGRLFLIHDSYPLSELFDSPSVEVSPSLPSPSYLHAQPDVALSHALRRPSRSPGRLLVVRPSVTQQVR